MTSYLKRFTLAVALAIASAFPALAGSIKVGFNAPLTGFAAADGNSALIGAQLAVEQVNAAGGVNGEMLELLVYDDQASPKESAPLAVKMITQDEVAAGISGSYSGSTRAAATIFQENTTPYISAYAVHPDITRAGDYVFRTSFMGEVQGRAGAKLIGGLMNLKRVVVITLNNDFGKSLAAGFKETAGEFGIEIASEYTYSIKDREFGPIVSKVKADAPDALYASGYFFTAGPLVRQLRAAGVTVPVIGQEGYDSQKFIEIAGPHAEGVIITTSLDRDSSEAITPGLHRGVRRQGRVSDGHGGRLRPYRGAGHGRGVAQGGRRGQGGVAGRHRVVQRGLLDRPHLLQRPRRGEEGRAGADREGRRVAALRGHLRPGASGPAGEVIRHRRPARRHSCGAPPPLRCCFST